MPILNPSPNYLPVLLVSVNAAPDDNFVTPRPRGQVDYLSHDWQEEDVWRSWRNMTRQKKEIANGVRLENASWRTWWKQRNKLPTVSPETLNWLKDSDVTWLYGPLHTAEDDKPSKPPGIAPSTPNTADAAPRKTTKPILKYRSITELLTSDLPTSPVFSPPESESESSRPPSPPAVEPGTSAPSPGAVFKRPKLQHTKSDTHITRWPSRAFRKDSPPRIEPPGHTEQDSYFPKVSATGAVRSSLSQDSNSSAGNSTERNGKKKHISFNTFVEQVIAIDKPKRSASFYGGAGERWDSSRRVYDDDDGYEEDQEDSADEETVLESNWSPRHIPGAGINRYQGPQDVDEEVDDGIIEMRSSFRHATSKNTPRSQSKASNTSSSSSVSTASSTTTSSTANSSSSPTRDSVALSSLSSAKRKPLTRRATGASYRSVRGGPPEHVHVTIAPIAPTVLKTEVWEENFGDDGAGSDDGIVWREPLWNHAADGKGKGRAIRGRARVEDDGSDASGTPVELVYVPPFNGRYSYGFAGYEEDEEDEDEEGDDFERSHGFDDEYMDVSSIVHSPAGEGTPSAVYLHRETAAGSVGFEDYEATERHNHRYPAGTGSYHPSTYGSGIPIPVPDESEREHVDYIDPTPEDSAPSPVPKLVVDQSSQIRSVLEEDENDFFDADADYGNEYMQRSRAGSRGGYVSRNRRSVMGSGSSRALVDVDERTSRSTSRTTSERSRSKSHSRTPSPAVEAALTSAPADPLPASQLRRTNSASASPSSSHLQPPSRGRSQHDSSQGSLGRSYSSGSLQSENTRGRSTSRASSNAPSMEGSTSPFAGSPDGSGSRTAGVGSAYVGGGRIERERRGREPTKERERGRDRTSDKRLGSASLSASPEPPTPMKREASSATDVTDSTYSSSASSSRTLMPEGAEEERIEMHQPQPQVQVQQTQQQQQQPKEEKRGKKRMTAEDFQREAEDFLRRAHPTPSNSPILEMRAPHSLSTHQRTTSSSSSRSSSGKDTPTAQSVLASAAAPAARPPPTLIPSPSSPVQPSTSQYTATSPTLKGGATGHMPIVKGPQASPRAGVSSSPSPCSSSPSGSVGADTEGSGGELSMRSSSRSRERTTPTSTESSIMGRAQEVAGAFLGWWNHA